LRKVVLPLTVPFLSASADRLQSTRYNVQEPDKAAALNGAAIAPQFAAALSALLGRPIVGAGRRHWRQT
jgi:hypothetical protein